MFVCSACENYVQHSSKLKQRITFPVAKAKALSIMLKAKRLASALPYGVQSCARLWRCTSRLYVSQIRATFFHTATNRDHAAKNQYLNATYQDHTAAIWDQVLFCGGTVSIFGGMVSICGGTVSIFGGTVSICGSYVSICDKCKNWLSKFVTMYV